MQYSCKFNREEEKDSTIYCNVKISFVIESYRLNFNLNNANENLSPHAFWILYIDSKHIWNVLDH